MNDSNNNNNNNNNNDDDDDNNNESDNDAGPYDNSKSNDNITHSTVSSIHNSNGASSTHYSGASGGVYRAGTTSNATLTSTSTIKAPVGTARDSAPTTLHHLAGTLGKNNNMTDRGKGNQPYSSRAYNSSGFTASAASAMQTGLEVIDFVYNIEVIRAHRFFGYHSRPRRFLKILLTAPATVAAAASVLLCGGVFGRVYQPYESNFPYSLHFLVDNNLRGMGDVRVRAGGFRFRWPLPCRRSRTVGTTDSWV